jgi:hypothetical protein
MAVIEHLSSLGAIRQGGRCHIQSRKRIDCLKTRLFPTSLPLS